MPRFPGPDDLSLNIGDGDESPSVEAPLQRTGREINPRAVGWPLQYQLWVESDHRLVHVRRSISEAHRRWSGWKLRIALAASIVAVDSGSRVDRSAAFARDGVLGPIRIMAPAQCGELARYLSETSRISAPIWSKGRAANDSILARVASHPALTSLLVPLLGEDLILWGASVATKTAGNRHPWHSDIESCDPGGGFVSAWLALRNVTPDSTLRFVAGSHRVGKTVQELRAEAGLTRGQVTDAHVLQWAKQQNPQAKLVEVAATEGDIILFDGRVWHASENRLNDGERMALLLQFASADTPVRIPVLENLKWPFRYLEAPRPPVITVHGTPRAKANDVVPIPVGGRPRPQKPIESTVRPLDFEPPIKEQKSWQPFPQFRGRTAALDLLSCHAAMLRPGFSPHPPHAHQDEELLIVLDGEAELLLADRADFSAAHAVKVKAGDFAYYPAFQHHSLANRSTRAVRYLMFRWNRAVAENQSGKLRPIVVHEPVTAEAHQGRGFSVRTIFEGRTQWLRKLHCHTSRLEIGAGYAPHADDYDVAILMQSGRVETLGRQAGPGDLIFYAAGELHGMRNVSDEPAHYLVFEWHGAPVTLPAPA